MTKRSFLQPYRAPQPPDATPPEPERITTVADLGSLRSRHAPAPQSGVFLANGAITLVLLCVTVVLAFRWGPVAGVLLVLSPAVAFASIRWTHVWIDLHVDGLLVRTAKSEHAIAFDDIDEIWVEQAGGGELVSLYLVTHDRTRYQIPKSLEGSADIFAAVHRRCSQPLIRAAFDAVGRGERLAFGKIGLDAVGVGGDGWSLRWDQLSLVRVVNGQFAIFRGRAPLPSHTVRFDEVPHPWLFWTLAKKLAPESEVSDPLGFLGAPPDPPE
ncbi:MAG TPA: DUF6585 family protein [Polyangiaceae bacterium]